MRGVRGRVGPPARAALASAGDRMTQRHPPRWQDHDQCTRTAADPGVTGVRRRDGRRERLMDFTPGLPMTDNFQHWPPPRIDLRPSGPGDEAGGGGVVPSASGSGSQRSREGERPRTAVVVRGLPQLEDNGSIRPKPKGSVPRLPRGSMLRAGAVAALDFCRGSETCGVRRGLWPATMRITRQVGATLPGRPIRGER
jgi:hypothetical protein